MCIELLPVGWDTSKLHQLSNGEVKYIFENTANSLTEIRKTTKKQNPYY